MEKENAGQEIAQLRKQIAELRQQVAELRQFFSIERLDKLPGKPAIAFIHCVGLTLIDPSNPGRVQARLMGGPEGPCLALNGEDEQSRVLLRVDKQGPQCQLMGNDNKPAVDISVMEGTSRGQVGVLDAGKPRALLK